MTTTLAAKPDEACSGRELAIVPVNCRYYGMSGAAGRLISTHGNQCALILEAHAPCQMEIAGETPDEKTCRLVLRIFGSADVQTSEALLGPANNLTRLSERCPSCGSDEVETKTMGGATWKHCGLCQTDFDPLEVSRK